ncbi:phage tail tip lysozyme [Methylobacterium sp. J-067]|uniref:phage tail tip lysozyme n=1 Tax=Methylobacterium sp. J-067 TaxID=2836648 RepID=UPI001FB897CF|nr:phage tail tip lysozyme [Methylobacterium sp. J-067]MCJ2025105.1 phage tail tip lysozyme [Methylobacterium sp. J-067]
MKDVLQAFAVALGFDVDKSSFAEAKKTLADYERAVKEAEKRIEDARWEGAKTEEEIAKLTRETRLKEARAALAEAQDREKSEKETARKREERHKEFVAGLNRAALAAAAAATAITYAVNKVTSAFDNLGFVSQRTGASVQSLNSLGYAFKQTGGSAQQAVGAVERFAQSLRGNDGLKSFVKGLGVDTSKDMGDVYLNTIEALSKHPYQVGSREAGMLGINEEDYKLVTDHIRQIREYRSEYNRTTHALGVDSQQATEASQSFWRSLTKLQATASALTDKLMVSLAPALEAIIKKFNDWVAANPERIEQILKGISQALEWVAKKAEEFGEWIMGSGGDLLMKRWDNFAERVERVARAVELIAAGVSKVLGLVERLSGTRTPWGDQSRLISGINQLETEGGGGGPGWLRRGYNAVRRGLGFGGDEDMTPRPGDQSSIAGRTFASKAPGVMRRLMADFGLSKDEASIVLGNLGHESAGFTAFEEGGNGPGRGWAQWTDPERKRRFYKYAKDNNLDIRSDEANYGFLKWELENTHSSSVSDLKNARSYQDKMIAFERSFEGAGVKAYGSRFGYAQRAREAYDRAGGPAASPTVPSMSRPNMTPGGFDPNNIDVHNLMRPATDAASPTTNNSTSNRTVHQTINNTTTITGTDRPKEAAKVMESAFGRMHGLALANAQSAVV